MSDLFRALETVIVAKPRYSCCASLTINSRHAMSHINSFNYVTFSQTLSFPTTPAYSWTSRLFMIKILWATHLYSGKQRSFIISSNVGVACSF
jgi:hypothetical protein